MNDLISIIVPIYMVEEYLKECLDSITSQTYTNLEIILVDDGSPDKCGEICDHYATIDGRIKVIHKDNGGLADARNAGLDVATGKYVGFIDSDDFIHKDMFKILYNSMQKYSVRICECRLMKVISKDHICEDEDNNIINYHIFDNITALTKQKEYSGEIEVIVCNKLYDINLFDNIRFPKGKIHEDEYTTYKLFNKVNKIATVDKVMYFYRYNPKSIMNSKFSMKRLDIFVAYEEQLEFYKSRKMENLYDKTQYVLLNIYKNYYYDIRKDEDLDVNLAGYDKHFKKQFNQLYKSFIKSRNFNFLKKLALGLFFVSPKLYSQYVNCRTRGK